MITNKDISIDSENGKITLNGNKYDLGTQGEIDTAVKDVYSVMGQLGAKNLIPYPYSHTTKTQNGVTFTDNGDGTITIVTDENGATANTTFEFQTRASGNLFLKAGKYKATGCPVLADGGIVFRITNRTVSPYLDFDDTGSGVTFTLQNDLPFGAIFTVSKDTVITTPIVVKPMLRLASDTDNTYQPYAKTNKQLTDQLATKQDALTFDDVPTENSTNPVKSGGVFSSIFNISGGGKTIIPANADMNTLEFTAVGEYITNGNNKAILNVPSPITNLSFYMKVINTLTNEITQIDSAWKERIQIIIPIDVANIYIREVKSGSSLSDITYGSWKKITPTAV